MLNRLQYPTAATLRSLGQQGGHARHIRRTDHEIHVRRNLVGIFFVAAEDAVRQFRAIEFGDHRGEQIRAHVRCGGGKPTPAAMDWSSAIEAEVGCQALLSLRRRL